MNEIQAEIPMPLPSRANQDGSVHWRKRQKLVKQQRETIADTMRFVRPPDVGPVTVELVRVSPRRLDDSNNVMALKAVQDEVTEWLGYDDDSHENLRWFYGQAKDDQRRAGYQAARITVREGHHDCAVCGSELKEAI